MTEKRNWEILVDGWSNDLQLPTLPGSLSEDRSQSSLKRLKRIEVIYLGGKKLAADDPISQATHVTYNKRDY